MGSVKKTVKELDKALVGLIGIPFCDAVGADRGKTRWDVLVALIVRVDGVLVKERKAAVLDALLRLLLDNDALGNIIRLLVSYSSWQKNPQPPSAGTKLQTQLGSFSVCGINLLERIIRVAAENYNDYFRTCNRVVSTIQYESIAKPGKGVQCTAAVYICKLCCMLIFVACSSLLHAQLCCMHQYFMSVKEGDMCPTISHGTSAALVSQGAMVTSSSSSLVG